jgi:Pyruvate/2-oxoacid:ferredoxin oxidoreductase delta subunit
MSSNDCIGIDCKECDAYWEVSKLKLKELAIKNYFLPTAYLRCMGCDVKVEVPLPKIEDL